MKNLTVDPIILWGSDIGLGVVRSLGMMNLKSILIFCDRDEVARVSKYVSKAYKCPSWTDHEAVKDFLLNRKDDLKNGILIPVGDHQVEILAKYKKELSKFYIVPVPNYEIAKLFLDKKKTYRIAKKAGIDFPLTFYPKSEEEALANAQNMQFPLMIKPREMHNFLFVTKMKLYIVRDKRELKQKLRTCFKQNFKIMITEIIPGPDSRLYEYDFYIDKNGEMIAGMGQIKLRQHPPNFGIGRVLKTIVNKDIEELTKKFLKYIPGFFGPGQLEFKLDYRDGKYKLIEMNGRLTLQAELYAKAGINFPYLFYQDWVNGKSTKIYNYIEDFHWIHLSKDILNSFLRHPEENYSYIEYIKPYFKKHVYCIESLSDPKPMILYYLLGIHKLSSFLRLKKIN